MTTPADEGVRLQKVLAAAGFGSRRKCELLISSGRVSVDGQVADELGTRVHPDQVVIRVDDQRIAVPAGNLVVALNKPLGVITAMEDDRGRPCVGDLIDSDVRVFHVGRLDADTEGLLLLTNDGELGHRLTHPTYGVDKTYVAQVEGVVGPGDLRRIRNGIEIEGRAVEVTSIRLRDTNSGRSIVEVVIHEGRNRIVRRLLAEAGFPVTSLTRTRFGPIDLGGLASGHHRTLTDEQTTALYDAVDEPTTRGRKDS